MTRRVLEGRLFADRVSLNVTRAPAGPPVNGNVWPWIKDELYFNFKAGDHIRITVEKIEAPLIADPRLDSLIAKASDEFSTSDIRMNAVVAALLALKDRVDQLGG